MKLVDDCKGAWRHYSTKALALAAGLQGAWMSIDSSIKADLPQSVHQVVGYVVLAVAALGLGGKFVDQSKPEDKQP